MEKSETKPCYIAMFSIHGLIRGENLELGRDADTGGQVTYVVELARALSRRPDVGRIDLFTRQITDKRVDSSYAVREEQIAEDAWIIRIPCGPKRYLRKEKLWPYLPGFVDNTIQHFLNEERLPDIIHGHYGDAGYIGAQLARLLGVPMVFTGHSLGRCKKQQLLLKGQKEEIIDKKFNFEQRFEAEEFALETATTVITSTHQEVEQQYKLYDHYQPDRMRVIPPGVDLTRFSEQPPGALDCPFRSEVDKFLVDPSKPIILAMARADERKNIGQLVNAYGKNSALQEVANLVLILGSRDDIQDLDRGARKVLSNLFYLIDLYDLYGKVAFPKRHQPGDVPDIYKLAASSKGVFVNPALTEPFGLTLIEAAATGVPIVATNDGGPQDIIGNLDNGILIDPLHEGELSQAMLRILENPALWERFATNGAKLSRQFYSWDNHVSAYLKCIKYAMSEAVEAPLVIPDRRTRLPSIDRVLITDVDNTLTGDDAAAADFFRTLEAAHSYTAFGIATGRSKDSALEILREMGAPTPEVLITSAGADIHYGEHLELDRSWQAHIDYQWNPEGLRELMAMIPGIYVQPEDEQHRFKLSYTVNLEKSPSIDEIRQMIREAGFRAKVVFSLGMYLDLLPIRTSTGLALRYLAFKWQLSPDHILVAGDSGNDEDMLNGTTLGVVVGNHGEELDRLRGNPRIYFAEGCNARGILDGIEYYDFFGSIKEPIIEEPDNDS